jgi:hypothetical protein
MNTDSFSATPTGFSQRAPGGGPRTFTIAVVPFPREGYANCSFTAINKREAGGIAGRHCQAGAHGQRVPR